jgi:pyruvate formate lyase activating enzyme
MAKERGIPVLSWTYNDPVVWQEFVLDTGKLAKENGLLNLYKSAFFISLEGAAELCEVVDIFSLSIKTLNEKMYRKMSKGWLQPVLDAAKYVYDQGKHVELSMLMITDANDGEKDARELAEWVLTHMSPDVPVHFVRFHPDYKYTHVGRTPVDRLVRAREVAKEMGIKYCYLGNVYGNDGTNTYCPGCDQLLVERYGLNTWIRGLTHKGDCDKCGMEHAFTLAQAPIVPDSRRLQKEAVEHFDTERAFNWRGDINACHLELGNETDSRQVLYYWRTMENGSRIGPYKTYTDAGQSYRFILSKSREDETGLLLNHKNSLDVKIFEVLDRAHYPTEDIDAKVPDTAMTV